MTADTKDTSEHNNAEPEDLLAVVGRMRSLPRVNPRTLFRAKVFLMSVFPTWAVRHIESRSRKPDRLRERVRPAWSVGVKTAVGLGVALVVLFLVFAGLTVAARKTNPGDSLYFLKRAREKMDLAFTWDKVKKAQTNLSLAETRLSELDYLIQKKNPDPKQIASVTGDYAARTRAVTDILKNESGVPGTNEIAARLKAVKAEEHGLEKRLAAVAGPESALAPASGALVTITDAGGNRSVGASQNVVTGRTDDNGGFAFNMNLSGETKASDLEARIELDGRTMAQPVYRVPAKTEVAGKYTCDFEPNVSTVKLNEPQNLTLSLTKSDGSPAFNARVLLQDSTSTALINGRSGEQEFKTDESGHCSFAFTKTSANRVSRITLKVDDGTLTDLGEVLLVGGVDAPGTGSGQQDVSTRTSGPAAGPQTIALDNGLVRITADGNQPGQIVKAVSSASSGVTSGPLEDPAAIDNPGVKVTGPRLLSADKVSASYEVECVIPSGAGYVRKTHTVTLARGKAFATVTSKIEAVGSDGNSAGTGNTSVQMTRLTVPPSAQLNISGKMQTAAVPGNPFQVAFLAGKPYAAYNTYGKWVVLACPIDSESFLQSWEVGSDYLGTNVYRSLQESSSQILTTVLGIADKGGIESITQQALNGIGVSSSTGADQSVMSEGFFVRVSPVFERLKKGEQQVTLTIYKQYQKALGQ